MFTKKTFQHHAIPLISFSVILGFTAFKHELQGSSYFCCNFKVKLQIRIANYTLTTKPDLTPTLNGYRSNDPPWKA